MRFDLSVPLVSSRHIAWAAGPFIKRDLKPLERDEKKGEISSLAFPVIGFCLPGRESELIITCTIIYEAMNLMVKTLGSAAVIIYQMCFVDDLPEDTIEAVSLTLCSNRLLFPEPVVDPIPEVTNQLTYSLAAQWMGIKVTAETPNDLWAVIGLAQYITNIVMATISGKNHYRFMLKANADRLCELDINRPSLYDLGPQVLKNRSDLEFVRLKASMVIYILETRLSKASGASVMSKVFRKIIDKGKGKLSTEQFLRACERVSYVKAESFFAQWVYGSGYPIFEVSQRFNKKKLVIEMGIRQVQANEAEVTSITPEGFMCAVRHEDGNVTGKKPSNVYTGPMTIRIHEADGTPYEHVVNITEAYTKLDIPYNTKYKRLKRSRRQKERAALAAGVNIDVDNAPEDVEVYCFGDVLQSEEEIAEWRIEEWSEEEMDRMGQESFEWIRMDADFEWICTIRLNQPDYMYHSQLQQDRDVVAQAQVSNIAPHPRASSSSITLVLISMD